MTTSDTELNFCLGMMFFLYFQEISQGSLGCVGVSRAQFFWGKIQIVFLMIAQA